MSAAKKRGGVLNATASSSSSAASSSGAAAAAARCCDVGIELNYRSRIDNAPLNSAQGLNNSFVFTSNLDGEWPESTRELCLYDLQPFEGKPVGIPRGYDEKRRMYRMQGYFCSWSCAFAYLEREKSAPKYLRNLNLFRQFLKSVLNIELNDLHLPPPLTHLTQLAAARPTLKDAVAEWRSRLCTYSDMRPVENLFVPVSQVFEERAQRDRSLLRQDRQAERMVSARAKPLIQTREAQRLQEKLIGAKKREKAAKRSAIDELLGVTMRKRPKPGEAEDEE